MLGRLAWSVGCGRMHCLGLTKVTGSTLLVRIPSFGPVGPVFVWLNNDKSDAPVSFGSGGVISLLLYTLLPNVPSSRLVHHFCRFSSPIGMCSIMPFRRTRRSTRPRRRRRNRRPVRRMRRRRMVVPVEQKNVDLEVFISPAESDGDIFLLNGVAQGVDFNQRQGRQHVNMSILIKYQIIVGDLTINAPVLTRVGVFLDLRPNPTLPGVDDIWDGNSSAFAVLGARNLDNVFRYKQIWSRTHRTDVGDQTRFRSVFKRLNFRTRYFNAGGTLGSIATGALYFAMVTDQAGTDNPPNIRIFSRLRFVG